MPITCKSFRWNICSLRLSKLMASAIVTSLVCINSLANAQSNDSAQFPLVNIIQVQLASTQSVKIAEIESITGHWIVNETPSKDLDSKLASVFTSLFYGRHASGYKNSIWEFMRSQHGVTISIPDRKLFFENATLSDGELVASTIEEPTGSDENSEPTQVELRVKFENGTFSGKIIYPNRRLKLEGTMSPYLSSARENNLKLDQKLRTELSNVARLSTKLVDLSKREARTQNDRREISRLSNTVRKLTQENVRSLAQIKQLQSQLASAKKIIRAARSSEISRGSLPKTLAQQTTVMPVKITMKVLKNSNVRAKPDFESPVLFSVKAGKFVDAVGRTSDLMWYEVNAGATKGFIFSELVSQARGNSSVESIVASHEEEDSKSNSVENSLSLVSVEPDQLKPQNSNAPIKPLVYPLTFKTPKSRINDIQVSIDGKTIYTATNKSEIIILDIVDGRQLGVLKGHTEAVRDIALSPDGNLIASGSDDNGVRVWDARNWKLIHSLEGHTGGVRAVSFTRNGKWLLSGSRDKSIRVWNVKTGAPINNITIHKGAISAILALPGGKLVYSASSDKRDNSEIAVWDLESGRKVTNIKGHRSPVTAFALSLDGKYVASGSKDRTIRLWDAKTHKLHKTLGVLDGHKKSIRSIAFLTGNKRIISGSDDNSILIWDVESENIVKSLTGHRRRISAVAAVLKGNLIVSGAGDKFVKVWKFVE
jgi:WD40 repeat protein